MDQFNAFLLIHLLIPLKFGMDNLFCGTNGRQMDI